VTLRKVVPACESRNRELRKVFAAYGGYGFCLPCGLKFGEKRPEHERRSPIRWRCTCKHFLIYWP